MPKSLDRWRSAWRSHDFRDQLFVSIAGLVIASAMIIMFLDYIESRNGTVLDDPLLQLFSPVDLRLITFSLIYSGIALGFLSVLAYPFALLVSLRAAVVIILMRVATLFLLPLDPPTDIIPLTDPFIQWPGVPPVLTRDLFFSGYTSLMALFVFVSEWNDMKVIFSCFGVAISALFLVHHAHYTIDVVAAPCFSYVAYSIAKWNTVQEIPVSPGNIRTEKPARPKGLLKRMKVR
jgi:hypothetical protein